MKNSVSADTLYGMRYPNKGKISFPTALFALELSAQEIAIYCYLLLLQSRQRHICHPSYAHIGYVLGMDRKTVQKYVSLLEEKQLISTMKTTTTAKRGAKLNGSLQYHILPIADAVRYYNDRQLRKADEEDRTRLAKRLQARNEQLRDDELAAEENAQEQSSDEGQEEAV